MSDFTHTRFRVPTRKCRRDSFLRTAILVLLVFLILPLLDHGTVRAADVPLDSPVYGILDRLWAEGGIRNYRPDSLPITREEAIELLKQAGQQEALDLIQDEKNIRVSPWVRLESGDRGFTPGNHSDIKVPDSMVAGIETGLDHYPFSFFLDGRFPAAEEEDPEITEAYGSVQLGTFRLTLGKEDLWWGPGRRGTLLLTNNAEAFTMLRLANYPGFDLPWIFRHLGEMRLNFFMTRLEKDRDTYISEPLMGGLLLSIAPHENLIFSLNRTFLYGGEGRDQDFQAFFRALLGHSGFDTSSDQKNVIGNQLGGISFVWRYPSSVQPLVFYGEFGGEDQNKPAFFIKLNAFLAGIYLPRLGASRLFDFRFEFANNDLDPDNWYTHSEYPYTYKDTIMGHAMGTDAEDYFGELGVYPFSNSRIALSAGLTKRDKQLSASGQDLRHTYRIKGEYWTGNAMIDLEWIQEDWDDTPAGEEEGILFALGVKVPL